MATQTRPLNLSNQNTNTSYNNLMDTQHEEDCQCEDNKSIQPFQSNFARQLHENEVMRRTPVARENRIQTEIASNQRPQQMEIAYNEQYPIEYIKQQTISHTPQQALQHSQQQEEQKGEPEKHPQQQQMEIAFNKQYPIEYIKQQSISHTPQ